MCQIKRKRNLPVFTAPFQKREEKGRKPKWDHATEPHDEARRWIGPIYGVKEGEEGRRTAEGQMICDISGWGLIVVPLMQSVKEG